MLFVLINNKFGKLKIKNHKKVKYYKNIIFITIIIFSPLTFLYNYEKLLI